MAIALALLAAPMAGIPARAADAAGLRGFSLAAPADFSTLGRVDAFRAAHRKLATEYAFTGWKGIDWPALYARALPAIVAADQAGDAGAYLQALAAYVAGIDDGHVSLPRNAATAPLIDAAIARRSGGTPGLSLAALDDGRVIAADVVPGEAAAVAGLQRGAEVLQWDGRPIREAIEHVDLGNRLAAARVATDAYRRLEQTRLLTRLAVGDAITLIFRNPDSTTEQTAHLVAVDDKMAGLDRFDLAPLPNAADEAAIIGARRIGDFGYIRLAALADLKDLKRSPEFIWTAYGQAIADFTAAGTRGLILDLRGNHGGYDILAQMICGTLYDQPAFYEATVLFNARTGRFRKITVDDRTGKVVNALMIEPQEPRVRGPVVALVNPRTISSAEGIARCVAGRRNGAVVGFHGTRGSFGIAGGEIRLPDGIVLHYPFGRVVDHTGKVMLDSRAGKGGVMPTVRVPQSRENILAVARGEDVELAAAVRWLQERTP